MPERFDSPEQFAVAAANSLAKVHQYVALCNEVADEKHLAKFNERPTRPALAVGDIVKVKDHLAAKSSVDKWRGDFKVLNSNPYVSQIEGALTKKTDWVSNHYLKLMPPRPLHLASDSEDEESVEAAPRLGRSRRGGIRASDPPPPPPPAPTRPSPSSTSCPSPSGTSGLSGEAAKLNLSLNELKLRKLFEGKSAPPSRRTSIGSNKSGSSRAGKKPVRKEPAPPTRQSNRERKQVDRYQAPL